MSFVFPGFFETFDKFFFSQTMLIREDLPTLLLPINAYSGIPGLGHCSTFAELQINSEDLILTDVFIDFNCFITNLINIFSKMFSNHKP